MYLQITTKCNMSCAHCCFSCGKNGMHSTRQVAIDMLRYAEEQGEANLTIGGGEPTLHPDFFDILRNALWMFDSVWMATNGSRTKTMYRLSDIMEDNDYAAVNPIMADGKLYVALSQDPHHNPIDPNIVNLWKQYRYEIRNTSNHIMGVGRAKKNQLAPPEDCACEDIILKPDGSIRLCGCLKSPIIGTIYDGIYTDWQKAIDDFTEYGVYHQNGTILKHCCKNIKRRTHAVTIGNQNCIEDRPKNTLGSHHPPESETYPTHTV